MELMVENVDVWAASVKDEPGALSSTLAALRAVGADLDFVLARRTPEGPDCGVVFVTPLRGDAEIAAAATLGFSVTGKVHSVRIEGPNEPGIVADLTAKLADAGLNLRGLSGAVIGPQLMLYVGLDSAADADTAARVLQHEGAALAR